MRADLTAPGVAARYKDERAVSRARRLRKEATPAERALWRLLRRVELDGSHFRRQAPMGPYIADFLCHGARLVIELDGGAHNAPDRARADAERQAWIEGRGYCVIRFANARVMEDAAQVASEIEREARARIRCAQWLGAHSSLDV